MRLHVEDMSAAFAAAANLLAKIREELEVGSAEHVLLLAELARGPRAQPPLAVQEQASMLIEGRPLPATSHIALLEVQGRELALRQRLEALRAMERRLAESLEIEREKARRAAVDADPRTAEIGTRWRAAEQAVRHALALEHELRRDLLEGAFGDPEREPPQWLQEWALH